MSRVLQLRVLIDRDPEKILDLIKDYQAELAVVHNDIEISGKTLEAANKEQASLLYFYDSRRVELDTIVKLLDAKVQAVRGRLYKSYTETYTRTLGERAKDKYIDQEPEFWKFFQIYLEVQELHLKYKSIVEVFLNRGFSLANITKARIASVHNDTID
ncbi:MAG: hypothetical protein ACREAU_03385 [Nitrosopumilaceae archaeon]